MGGLRSSVPLGESLPGLLGHKLKYDGWRVACSSPRWEAGLIIQFRSFSGRWASLIFSSRSVVHTTLNFYARKDTTNNLLEAPKPQSIVALSPMISWTIFSASCH